VGAHATDGAIEQQGSGSSIVMGLKSDTAMPQGPDDELETTAVAIIGANRLVTVVRKCGTPQELRWETRIGGNLSDGALFFKHDEV
jgi:hypothetical protein